MTSFVVVREALLPALGAAQKPVARRSTIPILQNVLVEARDGTVTITGSDLDAEVTASAQATIREPGGFTLPAGLFHDVVRKLPEKAEISLSIDRDQVTISAGRARFRLPILPVADFPRLTVGQPDNRFALDEADLARLIDTVSFAISTEETRYYLNGIYLHEHADGLVGVATDGHRLARLALALPEGASGMPSVIVPTRTVSLVKALCKGGEGAIDCGVSKTLITFATAAGVTIVSKLVDGTFPDYQRVIPQANDNVFRLDRATLAAAIDRVITIATDRSRGVKLSFGEVLSLAMTNPDAGSAEEEIALERVSGGDVQIGFNGRYCLDLLGAATGQAIEVALADAGSPTIFRPTEGERRPTFVLMPMRV